MPLVSSGRPSATGTPPVVVDSMQILFGGQWGEREGGQGKKEGREEWSHGQDSRESA